MTASAPKNIFAPTEWMVAILATVAGGLTIPFPAANVSWLGA
jgi:hypothetical protein